LHLGFLAKSQTDLADFFLLRLRLRVDIIDYRLEIAFEKSVKSGLALEQVRVSPGVTKSPLHLAQQFIEHVHDLSQADLTADDEDDEQLDVFDLTHQGAFSLHGNFGGLA
jgi:hypothetical protein